MTATADAFAAWSAFLGYGQGVEGDVSMTSADPGNFTPGGVLKGTKWGFSGRSYPDLDFASLTPTIADELRHRDFWTAVRGDEVPGPVGFVLAEAAWGSGPSPAIRQLQSVVGVSGDGAFGAGTMTALTKALAKPDGVEGFIVEYQTERLLFEAALSTWPINRLGWTRRMFSGTAHALALAGAPLAAIVTTTPASTEPEIKAHPSTPVPVPAPDVVPPAQAAMPFEGTWTLTINIARGAATANLATGTKSPAAADPADTSSDALNDATIAAHEETG